jgi:hypothetical protein
MMKDVEREKIKSVDDFGEVISDGCGLDLFQSGKAVLVVCGTEIGDCCIVATGMTFYSPK